VYLGRKEDLKLREEEEDTHQSLSKSWKLKKLFESGKSEKKRRTRIYNPKGQAKRRKGKGAISEKSELIITTFYDKAFLKVLLPRRRVSQKQLTHASKVIIPSSGASTRKIKNLMLRKDSISLRIKKEGQ